MRTVRSEKLVARSLRAVVVETVEPRLLFSSGKLDTSFSGDGQLVGLPAVQGSSQITSTVVQSDGKTIVAGISSVGNPDAGPTQDFYFVTRLNKDGTLDKSFSSDGTITISKDDNSLPAVQLGSDGKIVLASGTTLARITTSGKLDTSFGGGDGIATYAGSFNDAASLALRPDGKLIVGDVGGDSVRRFLSNGTLDKAFGKNGVESINSATSLNHFHLARVLRLSDGGIMVAGSETSSSSSLDGKVALVKLQASGQPDKSFSGDAVATATVGSKVDDEVNDAALQSDGRIVVAGKAFDPKVHTNQNEFVVRLSTDGSLDKHFDSDGIRTFVFVSHDEFSAPENANAIAVKSDGKIVVGGTAWKGKPVFAVAQLNSNGSDDTGFGTNGRAFAGLGTYANDASAIAVTADKKTVLAGLATNDGEDTSPQVVRFT